MRNVLKIAVCFSCLLPLIVISEESSNLRRKVIANYTFEVTSQINRVLRDLGELPVGFSNDSSAIELFLLLENGSGFRMRLDFDGKLERFSLNKKSGAWEGESDFSVKLSKERRDVFFEHVNSESLFTPPSFLEVGKYPPVGNLLALVARRKGSGDKIVGYFHPRILLSLSENSDLMDDRLAFIRICHDLQSEIPDSFQNRDLKGLLTYLLKK